MVFQSKVLFCWIKCNASFLQGHTLFGNGKHCYAQYMMVEEHLHSSEQESNEFYKAGDVDTDEKSLVESSMDYDVCND